MPHAGREPRGAEGPPRLRLWAGSLAMETGLLHVIASGDHFREWWGYGLFFLVVSLCQFIGGAALFFKCGYALYWTGIIGTAIVLAIWTLSRTTGVHIGPDGAGPEPIGLLDATCTGLEVVLIWCLVRLLRHSRATPGEDAVEQIRPHGRS
jgi:hypothetical protein